MYVLVLLPPTVFRNLFTASTLNKIKDHQKINIKFYDT